MEVFQLQYELVRGSRRAVMDFCETFSPGDYVKRVNHFGRGGSVRNMHTHIANTYILWLANFSLRLGESYFQPESVKNTDDAISMFEKVDQYMWRFLETSGDDWNRALTHRAPLIDKQVETTPLQLLTHVLTHEFHHKGQIMTMGRIMGYTPPDVDVVRF